MAGAPLYTESPRSFYILYVQEVVTILYSSLLYEMGNYFLDTQNSGYAMKIGQDFLEI